MNTPNHQDPNVKELINQYLSLRERGDELSPEEFARRHADNFDEIVTAARRVEMILRAKNGVASVESRVVAIDGDSGVFTVTCPKCEAQIKTGPMAFLEWTTCGECSEQFRIEVKENFISAGGRVGRYELIEFLGAGGFGCVWKARDTELDRFVALKMPNNSEMSIFEKEQFFREAQAALRWTIPGSYECSKWGMILSKFSSPVNSSMVRHWGNTSKKTI